MCFCCIVGAMEMFYVGFGVVINRISVSFDIELVIIASE